MRPVRTLVLLVLVLSFTPQARAAGLFLRWNKCYGDGGAPNRTFACDINSGFELLAGGFALGTDLAQVSGNEVVIDLASSGSALPAWWQLKNAGTCRQPAMNMNFVYDPAQIVCVDWAQGSSAGGLGAYGIGARGPNTARIVAAIAVAPSQLQDLSGGEEYFAFNILISHTKTVGSGACAGCTTPVCLVLASINVTTPVLANNRKLSGPGNGVDSDFVTWQGGAGVVVGGAIGCPAATPTVRGTWGSVKSLYR